MYLGELILSNEKLSEMAAVEHHINQQLKQPCLQEREHRGWDAEKCFGGIAEYGLSATRLLSILWIIYDHEKTGIWSLSSVC